MSTKETGDLGEGIACEYLVKNGYKILGKNNRINFGEIDIIAKKGKTIHFVEVKTLQGFHPEHAEGFFPEEHVDYKKQRKLKGLAEIWLEKQKMPQDVPYQIDIAAVSPDNTTGEPKIDFFENVVEGG